MKNKVLILTDSTVDLPEDIVKKRDITVVPLYIHLGDQELRDGIDINTDQMYEWIEKNKILPSTAAVSPHFLENSSRNILIKVMMYFIVESV